MSKHTFSPASAAASADAPTPEQMMNAPMPIGDAASMLRQVIRKNEKPYNAAVMKKNNDLVNEWYNKVLVRIANSKGEFPAGQVWDSWLIFFEGKEIARSREFLERLPKYEDEMVRYWTAFLTTKSIEELHDAGTAVVINAWQYITAAIRFHFAELKWQHVYSKSTDPVVWHREANARPALFKGEPIPFGLTNELIDEMKEKVIAITSIRVEPKH